MTEAARIQALKSLLTFEEQLKLGLIEPVKYDQEALIERKLWEFLKREQIKQSKRYNDKQSNTDR